MQGSFFGQRLQRSVSTSEWRQNPRAKFSHAPTHWAPAQEKKGSSVTSSLCTFQAQITYGCCCTSRSFSALGLWPFVACSSSLSQPEHAQFLHACFKNSLGQLPGTVHGRSGRAMYRLPQLALHRYIGREFMPFKVTNPPGTTRRFNNAK